MDISKDVIFGVSINNVTGITGKAYSIHDLVHAGVEAEAMGFDAVWVHDAMMGRRTTAAYCPINALTAIAAKTSNLRLATGILTPQVRNPVSTANQWATLYEISEGRAIMGVGMGAGKPSLIRREFEGLAALKHDTDLNPETLYAKRGKVYDECLDVMAEMLGIPIVDRRFHCEWAITPDDREYFGFSLPALGSATISISASLARFPMVTLLETVS